MFVHAKKPDTPYALCLWSNAIGKEDIRKTSKTWEPFKFKMTIERFQDLFYYSYSIGGKGEKG